MSDAPIIAPFSTTTGGLPVPDDGDLVMNGAAAIRALAAALDARPRLRARKAGNYNIAGSGANIVQGSGSAVWDAIETNYNNQGDTVGMVAPLAGYYLAFASAVILMPASQTNQIVGCLVSNDTQPTVEALHDQKLMTTGAGGTRMTVRVANLIRANAGDLLKMYVHQNTGNTQTLGGPTADWTTRFSLTYWGP